ncbi:dTDP-glucose 4,6-dehydratase [Candidatus Berkelbacteria bacterium]|nr:dTDP-glucose 4,6-dehydratase [Candidatus Berkelbacteria bacterium]
MKIFVTGGLGFMGSDFIRYVMGLPGNHHVLNYDKMTYAANPENVADVATYRRYRLVKGDIADRKTVDRVVKSFKPDLIVNYAAETHVDRSILDPRPFMETDIVGTQVLLDAVMRYKIPRFVQISTDEVYGSIAKGKFTETSPLQPNSPYAASKAGGDLMVRAYHRTFGAPVFVTHSCNNFGPYHYPEKVIPLFITNLLEGKQVPLYGDGRNVREWIYVRDHSRAVWLVAGKGTIGEVYNIGTGYELTNRVLTEKILKLLELPQSRVKKVKDRPGHDLRYALDTKKITVLGYQPSYSFDEGLRETVQWFQDHQAWWRRIKSGEYRRYYQQNYAKRIES